MNHPDQIYGKHGPEYQCAVSRLMADLYAAVVGAFDGGATEMFVVDGHHSGKNFIKEKLRPKGKHIFLAEWQDLIRSDELCTSRTDVERVDARTVCKVVHEIHNYADVLF